MNRRRLFTLGILGLGLAPLINGCASAAAEDSPPLELRGTYEATSPGPIRAITLRPDQRYELRPDGCTQDDCVETGTFAVDASQTTLSLTTDAGVKHSLALEVLSYVKAEPTETVGGGQELLPKALSTGGALPLIAPGTLIPAGTPQSATVNGQSVLLNNGTSCLLSSIQTVLNGAPEPAQNSQCGFYEKKTCDPNEMINFDFNTLTNFWDASADCIECGGKLTAAGVVLSGGVVSDGILAIPAGALASYLAIGSCAGCYNGIRDSPPMRALDCQLIPCQYATAGRQAECQKQCKTAYAFVSRVGTACQCTDDANEACCRVKCYDPKTKPDKNCQCN
jgi:hypothetical protein